MTKESFDDSYRDFREDMQAKYNDGGSPIKKWNAHARQQSRSIRKRKFNK